MLKKIDWDLDLIFASVGGRYQQQEGDTTCTPLGEQQKNEIKNDIAVLGCFIHIYFEVSYTFIEVVWLHLAQTYISYLQFWWKLIWNNNFFFPSKESNIIDLCIGSTSMNW